MKFGASLKDAITTEWQPYYLDYDILKKKLQQEPFTERDETEFVEMLDSNLEKVYAFHQATLHAIREETEVCATLITQGGPNTKIQEKMNYLADNLHRLERYSRFNYTGFLKIVKKHDRRTNYILRPMFMVRLNQCPFWKDDEENDGLLIKLSELFNKVRLGGISNPPSLLSNHGDRTIIVVKKFFVHTNDVLELKTSVLRHLPVLVYHGHTLQEKQDIDPPVSTLYLDNVDMDAYLARVESKLNSQNIRLRWYGSVEGNRSISVERRTLEDENRGELNEKFIIKDKYVNGYLQGDQVFLVKSVKKMEASGKSKEEIEAFTALATSIQEQITSNNMEPVLRTYYKRTAFQIPGDTQVRMALDTDLCFIREDSDFFPNESTQRRNKEQEWRRPDVDINFPFSQLKQDVEVNRYPYATFEIKLELAPHQKEPKWILDLEENSGLLEQAHHFTKFVHGMAIMFDTRVPLLPYWLAQIDDDRKLLPILPSQVSSVSPKQIIKRQKEKKRRDSSSEQTPLLKNYVTPSYASIENNQEGPSSSSATTSNMNNTTEDDDENKVGVLSRQFFRRSNSYQQKPIVLPPGVKIPKKIVTPIRVEPKVFFANERTYFSWMKFGTMLTTFSLALFNSGDTIGKICGVIYTLISISILLYGCGLYYRRRELIRSRLSGPYDEVIGPTLICLALLFAVGMNAYLKFNHFS